MQKYLDKNIFEQIYTNYKKSVPSSGDENVNLYLPRYQEIYMINIKNLSRQ